MFKFHHGVVRWPTEATFTCVEVNGPECVLSTGDYKKTHLLDEHLHPLDWKNTSFSIFEETFLFAKSVKERRARESIDNCFAADFWKSLAQLKSSNNNTQQVMAIDLILYSVHATSSPDAFAHFCHDLLFTGINNGAVLEVISFIARSCPMALCCAIGGHVGLVLVHYALMRACSFDMIKILLRVPAVVRCRDLNGYSLLHWMIITNRTVEEVEYVWRLFPDAIEWPTDALCDDIVCTLTATTISTVFSVLMGREKELVVSGNCTPLCMALDFNMRKTPPRNNAAVIKFLVQKSARVRLVADSTGRNAFEK